MLWEFRNSAAGGGDARQRPADRRFGRDQLGRRASSRSSRSWRSTVSRLMAVGLPNSGNSYRTVKYAPADFDVNVLRANAGGSVTPP